MKRFYVGIFIFQTIVYGIFYIASMFDLNAFTQIGSKVIPILTIIFYIFSVSITVFYPILKNKIRQKMIIIKHLKNKDLHDQIDLANLKIENGDSDSFLTYEDGVKDAILWILNESKKPLDESE